MTEVRYAIRRETDTAARVTRLHLIGRLDKAARPGLRRALSNALVGRRAMTLRIDMSSVIFLGSECVQELLTGYGKAMVAGHGYKVAEARGHIRRSLAAVRLCAPGGPARPHDHQQRPVQRGDRAVGRHHGPLDE